MKRITWQREAVQQTLDTSSDCVSAQRLHARLHVARSPIGLATICRALGDLAAQVDADSQTTGVSRETCTMPMTDDIDTEIDRAFGPRDERTHLYRTRRAATRSVPDAWSPLHRRPIRMCNLIEPMRHTSCPQHPPEIHLVTHSY
jgi:hypothetical protein